MSKQQQQQPDQNQNQEIEITVSEPVIQNSQLDKHTLYTVKGTDNQGPFEVQRRFKDFQALRDALILKWPGCFIPGLPGRKLFSGNDTKTVSDRVKFLSAFCYKLSRLPVLYYSTEVSQLFLRSKEKDVYKILYSEQMHKPNSTEIIQKYQVKFGHLQGKDIDKKLMDRIAEFTESVKQNLEQLKKMKRFLRETIDQGNMYNRSIDQVMNVTLTEYERQILSKYCSSQNYLIFGNEDIVQKLKKELNSEVIFKRINLWILQDLIKVEQKDCKAYLQMMKIQNDFEETKKKLIQKGKDMQLEHQNILQGKTGIMNLFRQKTPEELKSEIQLQMQQNTNEIENISNLLDIMSAIIGFIEIDQFEIEKKQNYQSILKQIQQYEQFALEEQRKYWQFILESTSALQQQIQNPAEREQKQQENHENEDDAIAHNEGQNQPVEEAVKVGQQDFELNEKDEVGSEKGQEEHQIAEA